MRAEESLFLAIGNIDEELVNDVLENVPNLENARENVRIQRRGLLICVVGVVLAMGLMVIGTVAVKSVLERNQDLPLPTPGENESGKTEPPTAAYERYPVVSIDGISYEALGEECEHIDVEIGVFFAQSESDLRNVAVYKIMGVDEDQSVAVYFPEEQKYYIYCNKAKLP